MQEEVVNRKVPNGNGWKILLVIAVVVVILIVMYFMLRSSDDNVLVEDVVVSDGEVSGVVGEVDDERLVSKIRDRNLVSGRRGGGGGCIEKKICCPEEGRADSGVGRRIN